MTSCTAEYSLRWRLEEAAIDALPLWHVLCTGKYLQGLDVGKHSSVRLRLSPCYISFSLLHNGKVFSHDLNSWVKLQFFQETMASFLPAAVLGTWWAHKYQPVFPLRLYLCLLATIIHTVLVTFKLCSRVKNLDIARFLLTMFWDQLWLRDIFKSHRPLCGRFLLFSARELSRLLH